jgi:putative phosphonate metabolism protein
MTAPRYAIYFAPASDDPLWSFGSRALGYDAETGKDTPLLYPPGFTQDVWRERTCEPRRYGFHATLKAPFHLRDDTSEEEIVDALRRFASQTQAFSIARLRVSAIGSFVALITSDADGALEELAASVVTFFDRFRAPLAEADLARRLASPLTDRQRTYLTRWGYPYVMEYFRFHMTLSGTLPADERSRAHEGLKLIYREAIDDSALRIGCISIFKQERRDGRFKILARASLGPCNPEALP